MFTGFGFLLIVVLTFTVQTQLTSWQLLLGIASLCTCVVADIDYAIKHKNI